MIIKNTTPLSLYVHLPWCIKKCPYCDFNSHVAKAGIPEQAYIHRLIEDLEAELELTENRKLLSIFFGGGTPSLFSPEAFEQLLSKIQALNLIDENTEITLEANPGTVDANHFKAYREIGINRLSIGIQSFHDQQLKRLGRIHGSKEAFKAIEIAKHSGFENFNLDIMFALPEQSIEEALKDLETAIDCQPTHLSWYQLTLEPNTVFYKHPPQLPDDETAWDMFEAGQQLLATAGFAQYEVSAYAQKNSQCAHNLNYWQFGDYIGIGAGAHGKITRKTHADIIRRQKYKLPQAYLSKPFGDGQQIHLSDEDKCFEFMLNALRLSANISFDLFTERTGLPLTRLIPHLDEAVKKGFITYSSSELSITPTGRRYLNNLIEIFLFEASCV